MHGTTAGPSRRRRVHRPEYQDDVESRAIYDLLEQDSCRFTTTAHDGFARLAQGDETRHQRLAQSQHQPHGPGIRGALLLAFQRYRKLAADNMHRRVAGAARGLSRIWPQVRVEPLKPMKPTRFVSRSYKSARINLGSLAPDDVQVNCSMRRFLGEIRTGNGQHVPQRLHEGSVWGYKAPSPAAPAANTATPSACRGIRTSTILEPGLVCVRRQDGRKVIALRTIPAALLEAPRQTCSAA